MGHRLISFLTSFSKWCHEFGTLVALPLMAIIITADVILRYFFNSPLAWGEEVIGLLLFLVLMLSMTFAWDVNKHIRMELVYVRLGPKWRAISDVATGLSGIVFFGLLGIQSIRDIEYMLKTNEGSEILHIPFWPFRALLALISFVFVMKLIYYIAAGRKKIGDIEMERDGIVIPREQS